MNAEFYKITILCKIYLRVIFTCYYTPPKPHFLTRVPIFSLSYDKQVQKLKE